MNRNELIDMMYWFIDDQLYNEEKEINGVMVQTEKLDRESVVEFLMFIEEAFKDYLLKDKG